MTTLELVLNRTGCADELAAPPHNWEQMMTAIAAGAIDHGDIDEVVCECLTLANASGARTWDDDVIDALLDSDGDLTSPAARTLVACGKAADDWLMHEGQHA
jgi:hypothetical protein